ncbi:MAG: NosD domain-containing protein [Candidatus Thermoplasmatota archaeon]|nr:NosD domain-containing protein [Candidatus Thermoplasmatota archaeon]
MSSANRVTVALMACLMLIPISTSSGTGSTSPFSPHLPFEIIGDADLQMRASIEGWPGDGSISDPFIIEDHEIDGKLSANGIKIAMTTLHVLIRNCTIENATEDILFLDSGHAIYIFGASNISIEGCTINNSTMGIRMITVMDMSITGCRIDGSITAISLEEASNITLDSTIVNDTMGAALVIDRSSTVNVNGSTFVGGYSGTDMSGSDNVTIMNNYFMGQSNAGIKVFDSSDVDVTDNVIHDCRNYGADIVRSKKVDLYSNSFISCSPFISGTNEDIRAPPNNTVNRRSLRFYSGMDMRGYNVPMDTGCIIAHNVSGLSVGPMDFENVSIGMQFFDSHNCSINDVAVNGSTVGFMIRDCSEISFNGCSATDAWIGGFSMYGTDNTTLFECSVSNSTSAYSFIAVWDIDILASEAYGISSTGMFLDTAWRALVEDMHLSGCGIDLRRLYDSRLERNWIEGCDDAISIYYSDVVSIINNTLVDGRGAGITMQNTEGSLLQRNVVMGFLEHAVRLDSCSANTISSNSFQFNRGSTKVRDPAKVQAYDDSSFNSWTSATGRGNHWTDHISPDNDYNGIVDEPYPLDGGPASDLFPLTAPDAYISGPPENVRAQAMNGSVLLEWDAPSSSRAGAIIDYSILRSDQGSLRAEVVRTENSSYTDKGLVNGRSYIFWIAANTLFGQGVPTRPIDIMPDGTGPIFSIIDPIEGSYVNRSEITLTLDVPDPGDIASMMLSLDDGAPYPVNISEGIFLENLTEGQHTVGLEAFDAAMNPSLASVTFHVDTIRPDIQVDPLPEFINRTYMEIPFNISDDGGIASITSYVSGVKDGIVRNNSVRLSGLSEGGVLFMLNASDRAGNNASFEHTFIVDMSPPAIMVISPAPGEVLDSDSIQVMLEVEDGLSGVDKVQVRLDSGDWEDLLHPYTKNYTDISHGAHSIFIRAWDRAGNPALTSSSFTYVVPVVPLINGTIKGRIVDDNGIPMSGAAILIDDGIYATTGADGSFLIEIGPGTYRLKVIKDGYVAFERNVTVGDGQNVELGDVELTKDPAKGKERINALYIAIPAAISILLILFIIALVLILKKKDEEIDVWGEE